MLTNLTGVISDAVDHIDISKDFISNRTVVLDTWNLDKKLSDHIALNFPSFAGNPFSRPARSHLLP